MGLKEQRGKREGVGGPPEEWRWRQYNLCSIYSWVVKFRFWCCEKATTEQSWDPTHCHFLYSVEISGLEQSQMTVTWVGLHDPLR